MNNVVLPSAEIVSEPRWQGKALTAARAVWATLFVFSVVMLILALPARYAQLLSPEDEIGVGLARLGYSAQYIEQYGSEAGMSAVLSHLGLSLTSYSAFLVGLEVLSTLAYVGVALVIFWRKSDNPMGIFASLFLITFGIAGSSYVLIPYMVQNPFGFYATGLLGFLAYSMFPLFFFLFPDGRLVPRWAWIPAGFWIFTTFFWNFAPASPLNPTGWPLWIYFSFVLLIWVSAAYAQIYRYRRVSNPVQRQQTKWLVFGFGLTVAVLLPTSLIPSLLLTSSESGAFWSVILLIQILALLIIPVALAISILRYRLWDIDLLIRRTLIYSILSGLLALTYFGLVVILQNIFTAITGQQSAVAIVISTLAIAALFFPLRSRVQDFIDRRFFRRKYDAQKILAEFAATARDETDLDKLTASLTEVVKETMQPEKVSLWLKPTERLLPNRLTVSGNGTSTILETSTEEK